jgi:hypothetical protein
VVCAVGVENENVGEARISGSSVQAVLTFVFPIRKSITADAATLLGPEPKAFGVMGWQVPRGTASSFDYSRITGFASTVPAKDNRQSTSGAKGKIGAIR